MAKESRINEHIVSSKVRLVGADGEQFGVMGTGEALQKARALDLDLVEVAPNADPPVCRIMDYGKYKYIQSKREAEARKKQTIVQVKEIKVRPKTDDHDLDIKVRHIKRFLEEGDKVKVTVRFRGRELTYASQTGFEILKYIVEQVADIAKVESPAKMEGKTMMAVVAPSGQKKKTPGPTARTAPAAASPAAPKAAAGTKTTEPAAAKQEEK